jgi:methylenetetrahydrofolate reductase (NADPH)
MSSFAAAAILVANGHEPILQVTCRDRNRIALAGDLIGAAAQGVENLLILKGDDPKGGDQPNAKPVFDYESIELLALARDLRDQGALPSGRKVEPAPHFFIGGADVPRRPDAKWSPIGLQKKIEAGADFVQTQFCFDLDVARAYIDRLRTDGILDKLAVIIGVGPIRSAKSARWMNENLFGVHVPEPIIARLDAASDQAAEGGASARSSSALARDSRRGGRARDGAGAGARCDRGRARVALDRPRDATSRGRFFRVTSQLCSG